MSQKQVIGRSSEQLAAWADLLELCEDGCEVFATTEAMRGAVISVEGELRRLHQVEEDARKMALLIMGKVP